MDVDDQKTQQQVNGTTADNGTNGRIEMHKSQPTFVIYKRCRVISRPHRSKNTSSKQSNGRELHLK